MAPSRRKGASKAAAAAAARRQWKVGDLVLAKVKGFPAWPATVSEPEKWGYSADWKKVLVYFFGTQQIAFCNPADVEAFTEEKKESLLSKRHGKGADFVRAVREIIDSYEELKKKEQVNSAHTNGRVTETNGKKEQVNSAHTNGQVTETNGGKSEECVASSGSKDEAPTTTLDSYSKVLGSSKANGDLGIPVEGDAATTRDILHNKDVVSEEPRCDLLLKSKATVPTTYSRKKYSGIQAFVMQRSAPSARRSRSSARAESCTLQKVMVPSDSVGKNNGNISNIRREGSLRRTKRARKSPDLSNGLDNDYPPVVSNGSPEENGSEIVTVDSDSQSFNEGISVQSGSKCMEPENVGECFGEDVKSSQRLDFQMKAVIIRKKRKPSRKRTIAAADEFPDRVDKQSVSGIDVHKTEPVLISDFEKTNGTYSKEDGDEHLPLVKRARVRLGRTSSSREELDTAMETGKPLEVSNSIPGQECITLSDGEDASSKKNMLVGSENSDNPSSVSKCTVNKPPLWEVKKHEQFGCLADGEAALPPSKRLHRALKAMSANEAEGEQVSPEGPSTMKTVINRSLSSLRDYSPLAGDSKEKEEPVAQHVESFCNNDFQACTSGISSKLATPVDQNIAVDEIGGCDKHVRTVSSPEHGPSFDAKSVGDDKDSGVLSYRNDNVETVLVEQSLKPPPDAVLREEALPECNSFSMASMLPLDNECEVETSVFIEPCKREPSDVSGLSSDPVPSNLGNGNVTHDDVKLLVGFSLGNSFDKAEQPSGDDEDDNLRSKDAKEIKQSELGVDSSPSQMMVEVLKTAVQGLELSRSTSISEECLSYKTLSGTRTSSSPTDGLDSTARASPPNTSICNISASENSNVVENNGCCSPGVHLHHEKPKHPGKWSTTSEANAALSSFEASLGTLTRTKKSIDRATRIAIECAKFGTAVKVVEIIACSLESEPSLHKRVDLFFLVDSIAQCSRGLKGDVGGLYPSAIQAVLPRLLLAAAPPGSSALENRRQCLKVLKLWQERKILPEPMIRHHIRELDSLNNMSSRISNSRRPFRNERAFDDPVREVEGMLVDEYGSNSSFQLAGFRMPTVLKDGNDGSDSDGEAFEAVTPEHNPEISEERDRIQTSAAEKHTHILEDVDGELEMEDVAPSCEGEMNATSNLLLGDATATSHHQHGQIPSFAPPLPNDLPPSSPPLPSSPPPPPPPSLPPLPPPPPALHDPVVNCPDPQLYVGTQNGNDEKQLAGRSVHYHPPEGRDPRMDAQAPDLANSCSFSSLPVPRAPVQAPNNAHLRPPHPAPSSQFSYFQSDLPRREIPPPSYPGSFHFVNSTDSGNFHSDHDRIHAAPPNEGWRFPPPFSGPCHPDGPRPPYASNPNAYAGPPCEPPISNNAWPYPPRPVNHREMAPHRPFSEASVPVAMRGPNFWRPR